MRDSFIKPIRKQSLYRSVAEQVIRLIEEGYLKPGDKLPPERALCEQLKVSRASLREGLKSLSRHGIIESKAGSGIYVKSGNPRAVIKNILKSYRVDHKSMHELVEAWEAVELFIGKLAVERDKPNDIHKMQGDFSR